MTINGVFSSESLTLPQNLGGHQDKDFTELNIAELNFSELNITALNFTDMQSADCTALQCTDHCTSLWQKRHSYDVFQR